MSKIVNLIFVTFFMLTHIAQADVINEKNVPQQKKTKAGLYLTAKDAYEILKKEADKTLFIDVRTRGEIAYVGMPTVADANIPFKFTSKKYQWHDRAHNFKMTPNPDFVNDVSIKLQQKGLNKNDNIFVMCRSGGRSAKATDALTNAGFSRVFSIIDGFEGDNVKSGEDKGKRNINGWKNGNLPWSYSLDKNKMYLSEKGKGKKNKNNKMLKKMDSDHNDIITQQEFDAFHKKMFGNIDHDHDGILNKQELQEFKKQKKQDKKKHKE